MDEITSQVFIDLVTNTPFVGFLVWQYVQMRKDIKEQHDKTDKLRFEAIERQELQRERFEKVIAGLNEDKDQLVTQLEKRLETVEKKFATLESQIRKLFSMIKQIRDSSDRK